MGDGAMVDSGDPTDADVSRDSGMEGAICARTSSEALATGETVTVCEQAHPTPPLVRLPADTPAGAAERTVYGGVAQGGPGEVVFRTREGDLPLTDAPWLDAEGSPTPRYGYLLYRATVRSGSVEAVEAVVRIDDAVFQRLLTGLTLEGVTSRRELVGGEEQFTWEALDAPIRVQLDAEVDPAPTEAVVTGQPRYRLRGVIENATTAVQGADGSCLPALSDLGDENPLATATDAEVVILRHPNMHGGFDDVFTFDWPAGTSTSNNMGTGLFIPAADLLLDALPNVTRADSTPHGTPWGGPNAELQVVRGGGGDC